MLCKRGWIMQTEYLTNTFHPEFDFGAISGAISMHETPIFICGEEANLSNA